MKVCGFVLIFYVWMVAPAWAAVSLHGTIGGVDTPSSDVLRFGQYILFGASLEQESRVGIGFSVVPRLEITAFHAGRPGVYQPSFGIKYALREEGILKPGLAMGITDAANRVERSAYAVMSKGLPKGIRVHLGWGTGFYEGAFCSFEKQLSASKSAAFSPVALVVEYSGKNMKYGVQAALDQDVSITAGWRGRKPFAGIFCYY